MKSSDHISRLLAEFLGTAFLLAAVVGSGIMGERLAAGNSAIALLANSVATGAMLVVLILTFGPVSGAHFNPAVSLVMAYRRGNATDLLGYTLVQVAGAFVGVASANIMFGLSPLTLSQHVRAGGAQLFSEFIATFGLVIVILVCSAFKPSVVAFAVAGYITAAYWFTSSTSFANPAVTLARAFTDTFSGIRLSDVPAFVMAQVCGAAAATFAGRLMLSTPEGNDMKKRVLFLCTGNSARSQMAEGLLRSLAGDRYEVFSAGTHPKGVHPLTIEAMRSIGVSIENQTSKDLSSFSGQKFDYVITVCDRAKQACPVFPGSVPIHWGFDDPAEAAGSRDAQLKVFDRVRDEIMGRLRLFVLANKD